jgi:hypothetical protein
MRLEPLTLTLTLTLPRPCAARLLPPAATRTGGRLHGVPLQGGRAAAGRARRRRGAGRRRRALLGAHRAYAHHGALTKKEYLVH